MSAEQQLDDQLDADRARTSAELASWREVGQIIAREGCQSYGVDDPDVPAPTASCLNKWSTTPGRWCAPCRALALLTAHS